MLPNEFFCYGGSIEDWSLGSTPLEVEGFLSFYACFIPGLKLSLSFCNEFLLEISGESFAGMDKASVWGFGEGAATDVLVESCINLAILRILSFILDWAFFLVSTGSLLYGALSTTRSSESFYGVSITFLSSYSVFKGAPSESESTICLRYATSAPLRLKVPLKSSFIIIGIFMDNRQYSLVDEASKMSSESFRFDPSDPPESSLVTF